MMLQVSCLATQAAGFRGTDVSGKLLHLSARQFLPDYLRKDLVWGRAGDLPAVDEERRSAVHSQVLSQSYCLLHCVGVRPRCE